MCLDTAAARVQYSGLGGCCLTSISERRSRKSDLTCKAFSVLFDLELVSPRSCSSVGTLWISAPEV